MVCSESGRKPVTQDMSHREVRDAFFAAFVRSRAFVSVVFATVCVLVNTSR
jgi:hypothetical protein